MQANGPNKERDGLYLGVYATIMAVMVAAMMGGGYLMATVRLRVAGRLHKNMLNMQNIIHKNALKQTLMEQ